MYTYTEGYKLNLIELHNNKDRNILKLWENLELTVQ